MRQVNRLSVGWCLLADMECHDSSYHEQLFWVIGQTRKSHICLGWSDLDCGNWKRVKFGFRVDSRIQPLTYALPFAHPAVFGTHHSNHSIEIIARAVVNVVLVVFHSQKFFAIVTSFVLELLEWLQQFHRKLIRIVDFDAMFSSIIYSPLPTSTPNTRVIHVNLWEWLRTTFSLSIDLYFNFGNLCEQASGRCDFLIFIISFVLFDSWQNWYLFSRWQHSGCDECV